MSASADDQRHFDALEAAFDGNSDPFSTAVEHMEDLKAAHPDAEKITWLWGWTCVTTPSEGKACRDTEAEDDRELGPFQGPAGSVMYYSKDPGRTFIAFNVEDPPLTYMMYAPDDADPGAFAGERGFRSYRLIGDGWTLLGPIDDQGKFEAQFPLS